MAKKLFLGTANPVKVRIVQAAIRSLPLDLLTPDDLRLDLQVAETGQTVQQNAAIKARAYCASAHLPTLAIDGGLWVEKFPAEKQPGHLVLGLLLSPITIDHQSGRYDSETPWNRCADTKWFRQFIVENLDHL